MITPLLPFLFSFVLNTQPPMPPTDIQPSTISQKAHAQPHTRRIKWVILTREGTCLPLTSLNQEFPDFPQMTSPQALHQYLSKHHGTPVLSPIKDPSNPDLAGYSLLDLVTYFTVGPKEARAWTITRGTKGPQAAGVIHTDFEKGFIRAETIAYADYVSGNGEAGAKEAGKMRLEGKEYVVQDGDVMHFRFAN